VRAEDLLMRWHWASAPLDAMNTFSSTDDMPTEVEVIDPHESSSPTTVAAGFDGPLGSSAGRPRWRGDRGTRRWLARALMAAAVAVAAVQIASGLSDSHAGTTPTAACPVEWSCSDIGGASPAGGQILTGNTWRLYGGGSNIWGLSDSFHFVWQGLAGDGSVSAHVVMQTDTDQNAKAGVMLRSGTDPASPYYAVFLTPLHGLVVQYRTATGQDAANAGGESLTAPAYVEVIRIGSAFTAMTSADGQTWTKVSGSTESLPALNGGLLAGLAVTSHDVHRLGTAIFDTVNITDDGPAPVGGTAGTSGVVPSTTSTTAVPTSTSTTTTSTTVAAGPASPSVLPGSIPAQVAVCGTALCVDGSPWSMYGSTIYNPGLTPYQSGIKDPAGTIALAEQAHLNTIRITDFLNVTGNPASAQYDPTDWADVDAMIAAARNAGIHVDLELSDYRALLWNNCVNPYTGGDWASFINFVGDRVNTVDGLVYKSDPTIALVSIAGEPLPVGPQNFTAKATNQPCTFTYSTTDLLNFYNAVATDWEALGGSVLINTGGLGYLNGTPSASQPFGYGGIDWQAIFSLPSIPFCDIKTYGGMQAYAATVAAYCHSIGKPIIDEEFGWTQNAGDAQRAQLFDTMFSQLSSLGFAGEDFWNLGYQIGPTSYEVNPATPLTFAAVQNNAP